MTTSRFGAVVDGLVTLIQATNSTTFDGPPLTSDIPADYVIVGGTDDPDDSAGEFSQEWNGLGARTKQETGTVTCAVLAGTGEDNVKTARDRALNVLGQIETAIRTDPTLAGAVVAGWCHITSGAPSQRRTTNGTYVRIQFDVAYQSHI